MSGVTVNAQANIGHAVSCITANGTCFVGYIPPRTANPEKAIIFMNVGNAQKNIYLTVEPDYPAQLLVYANVTNQSVYTNSEVIYTIKAIDALGNPAPNGTIVNFSYNGGGFLSATSCLIENGVCNVTYHTPQNPSMISFEVISGSVQTSFYLNVVSRLITNKLFDFGANSANGSFCIQTTNPYTYKQITLQAGENVTWVLNQSLSISSAFVLSSPTDFNNFINMVQNASTQYNEYEEYCGGPYSVWGPYSVNTSSYIFCNNYQNTHFSSNISYGFQPYITVQNNLQSLNPVIVSLPSGYVGKINFVAQNSGTYYFVIFASGLNPGIIGETINPVSNICYSSSYAYNTTIYNK
jgi:hypothetical protein